MSFSDYLEQCQQRVGTALNYHLPAVAAPAERLKSAMHYSVLSGGKRVRASLVYASAGVFAGRPSQNLQNNLDLAACAVELIHAYSLIHDDLPSMDNDDLRRGKPTCHIAYDEATAILAGDALQTLAFELLGKLDTDAGHQLNLIKTLASASGYAGMVGGQVLDIEAENNAPGLDGLEQIHRLKTGALIGASVRCGALLTQATETELEALDSYAAAIGLAFQVQDDILDVTGKTEELGKQQGADEQLNKATYPGLLGLDGAIAKAQQLHRDALTALEGFGPGAEPLRQLSSFIIERTR